MTVYRARYVDSSEEKTSGGMRLIRHVFEIAAGDDTASDWRRREVAVPLDTERETEFWTGYSAWRPAAVWATFFAATRHEVLEALFCADEDPVELEAVPTLLECAPPEDAAAEPWPPTALREARASSRPAPPARPHPRPRTRAERLVRGVDADAEVRTAYRIIYGGAGVLLLAAFLEAGARGVLGALILVLGYLAGSILTGGIACHLAGKLVGVEFGYLRTAIPKLGAAFIAPPAVLVLISAMMGILVMPLLLVWGIYLIMLNWLFDLDKLELAWTFIFTVILQAIALAILLGSLSG
jgi:hypothetical protein